ncbi:MAG: hypothetical protein RLY93_00440 [Sumerlaeia bacterium]
MIDQTDYRPRFRLGATVWRAVETAATWVVVCSALFALHWGSGETYLSLALYMALCGMALLLSLGLYSVLLDAMVQLNYRDKFVLFLVHVGVMFLPMLVGYRGVFQAFGALLAFMCLLKVQRVTLGRILMVSSAIVCASALFPPLPPMPVVAAFALGLLVAMRADHVFARLDRYTFQGGLLLWPAVMELFRSAVLPWALGVGGYFALDHWWGGQTRTLTFSTPQAYEFTNSAQTFDITKMIWELLIFAALVAACLGVIYWLDKQLRSEKSGESLAEEGLLGVREDRRRRPRGERAEPELSDGAGARARILHRFRQFTADIGEAGYERQKGETAPEYLARLLTSLTDRTLYGTESRSGGPEAAAVLGPFQKAAYARENDADCGLTEADATAFAEGLNALTPRLKESLPMQERRHAVRDAPGGG